MVIVTLIFHLNLKLNKFYLNPARGNNPNQPIYQTSKVSWLSPSCSSKLSLSLSSSLSHQFVLLLRFCLTKWVKMEARNVENKKILCLHGFRTSGSFLKKQISKWDPLILAHFDMVCHYTYSSKFQYFNHWKLWSLQLASNPVNFEQVSWDLCLES